MKTDLVKANGIHYTPPALARFLASAMLEHHATSKGSLTILDPACGDGSLLVAIANALPAAKRRRLKLFGYETDAVALVQAEERLKDLDVDEFSLECRDFLDGDFAWADSGQMSFFDQSERTGNDQFDMIIANPPYVRTQVLGSSKAQKLARKFRLSGRVDLYHAFAKAMAARLRPGGVLGLLTSNRFLTVRSGAALRHLFRTEFCLRAIYDLGDTRLFSAAVLPVIIVARRSRNEGEAAPTFLRVYENRRVAAVNRGMEFRSVLEAASQPDVVGDIRTPAGVFHIERGVLSAKTNSDVWSLSNPRNDNWLGTVGSRQAKTFADVAEIRVGIKTTADEVFIREDWTRLAKKQQPEAELTRPLLTHRDAARWTANSPRPNKSVLYPYETDSLRRTPVALDKYPAAARYLNEHRERLTKRHYVVDSGRKWFEIWVPHTPAEWSKPKIVFPDISEEPRFFLDETGAIVNGDCYWITLRKGVPAAWLRLLLAVGEFVVYHTLLRRHVSQQALFRAAVDS